jgi:hypothetical protein
MIFGWVLGFLEYVLVCTWKVLEKLMFVLFPGPGTLNARQAIRHDHPVTSHTSPVPSGRGTASCVWKLLV